MAKHKTLQVSDANLYSLNRPKGSNGGKLGCFHRVEGKREGAGQKLVRVLHVRITQGGRQRRPRPTAKGRYRAIWGREW